MAIQSHVAEKNIVAGTVGGILFGEAQGVLVDGDLTSKSAALSAVDSDMAKKHVAEKTFGPRVKAAINQADNYYANYTSGSDVSDITDALPNQSTRGRALRY